MSENYDEEIFVICLIVGVDCSAEETGPKSLLILDYKGRYTTVRLWRDKSFKLKMKDLLQSPIFFVLFDFGHVELALLYWRKENPMKDSLFVFE